MKKGPLENGPGSLLAQTKKLLRRSGLRARKGLGQHFLVDSDALETVVAAAELAPEDTVIEVGPGLGILTRELAAKAGWVIAIELDDKLADALTQSLAGLDNVVIINRDILGVDPALLLRESSADIPPGLTSYKVVANLPYYITSPVIRHFLEASGKPEVMVLMVQKEVAEVIAAQPGRMSLLSIGVQFYGRPDIITYVPASSFYPVPEVDSAVLRIDVYPRPPVDVDTQGFFRLVRAGFAASRKQFLNSLAQGLDLPKENVRPLLESTGIEPRRRAETLTIREWAQLWQAFDGSVAKERHAGD
jgi:16S rRNA (adenine1518-N6/adenine1519-N6)-dimethyltransferase